MIAGAKRRVIFAYRHRARDNGSTRMRVHQLADMLRALRPDGYEIETAPILPYRYHEEHERFLAHATGAVVIALQGALVPLGRSRLDRLRKTAAGLCLDHVDFVPADEDLPVYHVHILASHAGRQRVTARLKRLGHGGPSVMTVTHHADPRLPTPAPERRALRLCYLGNPAKMAPPAEPGAVDVLTYEDQTGFEAAIAALAGYPMHYAVRRRSLHPEVSKPFTKGFTAAKMGANLLVDAGTDDALHYLGPDYPYLIASRAARHIAEGLARARDDFGGPDWARGLEIMAYVREVSSPRHIVAELEAAMDMSRELASVG